MIMEPELMLHPMDKLLFPEFLKEQKYLGTILLLKRSEQTDSWQNLMQTEN